jgi:hypothetical protein
LISRRRAIAGTGPKVVALDVGEPERTLQEVARVLKFAGFVQFSIAHPATSTPIRRWVDDDNRHRQALAV